MLSNVKNIINRQASIVEQFFPYVHHIEFLYGIFTLMWRPAFIVLPIQEDQSDNFREQSKINYIPTGLELSRAHILVILETIESAPSIQFPHFIPCKASFLTSLLNLPPFTSTRTHSHFAYFPQVVSSNIFGCTGL